MLVVRLLVILPIATCIRITRMQTTDNFGELILSLPQDIVMKYYDPALAMKQKQKLALESISGKTFKKSVFEAVEISFGVVPVKELYHQQKNEV